MQQFVAEARRHCGTPVTDIGAGAQIITTDSLVVDRLDVPDSIIESAWASAAKAGVFELPGRVERNPAIDDAFMYVVELRRGDDYRASAIEHMERAETDADRRIRDVYTVVSRILPPELQLKP